MMDAASVAAKGKPSPNNKLLSYNKYVHIESAWNISACFSTKSYAKIRNGTSKTIIGNEERFNLILSARSKLFIDYPQNLLILKRYLLMTLLLLPNDKPISRNELVSH